MLEYRSAKMLILAMIISLQTISGWSRKVFACETYTVPWNAISYYPHTFDTDRVVQEP